MHPQQLLDFVIKPTLEQMGSRFNSRAAQQLLMLTIAQESSMGHFIRQVGGGPAISIYQFEPATLNDLYENFLEYRPNCLDIVSEFEAGIDNELFGNNFYATALARMQYFRDSKPLPEFDDRDGMWEYYKRIWNTHLGAATYEEFQHNWDKYVSDVEF